jgi:hypothetical protein
MTQIYAIGKMEGIKSEDILFSEKTIHQFTVSA